MSKVLSNQDLKDILTGATVLGAGGGGPFDLGQQFIDFIGDYKVTLMDASEMGDAERVAVSAGVGSPTAAASGFDSMVPTKAWEQLSGMVSDLKYVMPGEIGAANTLLPMTVCATQGLPLLDTTGARRAMPSLQMATFAAGNIPPSPIVLGDGTHSLWFHMDDVPAADAALRGIVTSGTFPGDAGMAFWNMSKADVVASGIHGTVSCAQQVGAAIRTALASGSEPISSVLGLFPGSRELFRGTIQSAVQTSEGGFDLGTLHLKNANGDELVIVNKNENLVAWSPDQTQPLVLAPDLICYLCTDGTVFSNADTGLAEKKTVCVLAIPATPQESQKAVVDAYLGALQQVGYYGSWRPMVGRGRGRK